MDKEIISVFKIIEMCDAQIERADENIKFARKKQSKENAKAGKLFFESIKHHLNSI